MKLHPITFGIVTDGNSVDNLTRVINSIRDLRIPTYEILIVGDISLIPDEDLRIIHFDESEKTGWITKKKNLISELSAFDLIVYLHDYYVFDAGWYTEVSRFGFEFDVCMHRIETLNGIRYHDWVLWVKNGKMLDVYLEKTRAAMLPYSWTDFTDFQYIPGGYFFAKKQFMKENLFDEGRVWGEAEDVEWSLRIRAKCSYKVNPNAVVRILKQKTPKFRAMTFLDRLIIRLLKQVDLISRKDHKIT